MWASTPISTLPIRRKLAGVSGRFSAWLCLGKDAFHRVSLDLSCACSPIRKQGETSGKKKEFLRPSASAFVFSCLSWFELPNLRSILLPHEDRTIQARNSRTNGIAMMNENSG